MAIYDGNTEIIHKSSLICKDLVFTGNIECDSDIVLEGVVNGNVTCHDLVIRESGRIIGDVKANSIALYSVLDGNLTVDRNLTIFENAQLNGDVVAESIICEGTVKGNIDCATLLQLKNKSVVKGDCSSQRFVVDENVVINGMITTKVVEKEAVVEEVVEKPVEETETKAE